MHVEKCTIGALEKATRSSKDRPELGVDVHTYVVRACHRFCVRPDESQLAALQIGDPVKVPVVSSAEYVVLPPLVYFDQVPQFGTRIVRPQHLAWALSDELVHTFRRIGRSDVAALVVD